LFRYPDFERPLGEWTLPFDLWPQADPTQADLTPTAPTEAEPTPTVLLHGRRIVVVRPVGPAEGGEAAVAIVDGDDIRIVRVSEFSAARRVPPSSQWEWRVTDMAADTLLLRRDPGTVASVDLRTAEVSAEPEDPWQASILGFSDTIGTCRDEFFDARFYAHWECSGRDEMALPACNRCTYEKLRIPSDVLDGRQHDLRIASVPIQIAFRPSREIALSDAERRIVATLRTLHGWQEEPLVIRHPGEHVGYGHVTDGSGGGSGRVVLAHAVPRPESNVLHVSFDIDGSRYLAVSASACVIGPVSAEDMVLTPADEFARPPAFSPSRDQE
jgi:hypothetical protein